MAKEFITEDDVSTSYITSSRVYELINGVKPDYLTVNSEGYITLPGGITFEWGSVEVRSNEWEKTVTLRKPLSKIFQAYVSIQNSRNEAGNSVHVKNLSTTTLTLYKSGSSAITLRWFVVGTV